MTSQSKQVSAPTRPCLSCGGLGTDASSGHTTLRGFVRDSCPVCLGSGRVEARLEGFASTEAREAWLKGANGCSNHGISGFAKEPAK